MDAPSSTGASADTGWVLAVEEDPLPDFQVHKEPEAITMVPDTLTMFLY
jgi:hypothetical protein